MTKKSKGFYWVAESFSGEEWNPGYGQLHGILFSTRRHARDDATNLKQRMGATKTRVVKYVRAQD